MISHQKITSFRKWGMKRGRVRCCSYKDSPLLLFFSFNPLIFLYSHLPLSPSFLLPMPWAHLHPSACRLALGTSLDTASGLCWPSGAVAVNGRAAVPTGVDVHENWQKIKDTEEKPPGSPVKGQELSLLRTWPSPSPAHWGFMKRGKITLHKLLLKPRSI